MKKNLFIVVNVDWFFLSHRLPIALAAIEKGYSVTILAGETGRGNEILSNGLNFIPIPIQRSGTNPIYELKAFYSILSAFLKHKPDIIHNVALKSCLYGGIASRILKTCTVINAISGLGYIFTTDKITFKQRAFSKLLKLGFHSRTNTIFQNPEDLELFKELRIISKYSKTCLIKGSGVDIINKYKHTQPKKKNKIIVLLPARMLYSKGIHEFCRAAGIVNSKVSNIEFILAGDVDDQNRSNINEKTMRTWENTYGVTWLGHCSNMVEQYIQSDIVILPSYREGLPKSLIEACAIGRPIITTDTAGCKECVIDKNNGFLVPVKDYNRLAEKTLELVNNTELRILMGNNSRKLAEKEFSIEQVITKTLKLYT